MKLNRLVSTSEMDHETWLEYRKKGIGGWDAGSICGLNPYATAISVYQDKIQEEVTEKEDNESMRQGRDLEEYVARRFMEETGKKVRRANSIIYYRLLHFGPPYWLIINCASFALGVVILTGCCRRFS